VIKDGLDLFVSQPAVCNALGKLQRDSGVRLSRRAAAILTLSDHGKAPTS
jgi:DNA-binding transcriptional LysR family regulator